MRNENPSLAAARILRRFHRETNTHKLLFHVQSQTDCTELNATTKNKELLLCDAISAEQKTKLKRVMRRHHVIDGLSREVREVGSRFVPTSE